MTNLKLLWHKVLYGFLYKDSTQYRSYIF